MHSQGSSSESDEEDEDDPRAMATPVRRRRVSEEEEDSGKPSESVDVEALPKTCDEEDASQAPQSEILGVQVFGKVFDWKQLILFTVNQIPETEVVEDDDDGLADVMTSPVLGTASPVAETPNEDQVMIWS